MAKIEGINVPKPEHIKNYIINGDMRISQRGTSFVSPANGNYTLDRFLYQKVGGISSTHTVTQDTDVPSLAQAGYLFQNSLRLNLTAADTSIGAGEITSIEQRIEGYNWANLAQKALTLSFWVKATLTGTYCVALTSSNADRSYTAEYVINASNTWEYKTITIAASPSAGTWNYTNGIGLRLLWILAAGTNFHTTPGSWQVGALISTANQVNGVNTGATDFRITGVALNEGTLAMPFSLHSEDFGAELLACYRYYWRHDAAGESGNNRVASTGQAIATTVASVSFRYPVKMRGNPTFVLSAANHFAVTNANEGLLACTAITAGEKTSEVMYFNITVASGLVAGNATQFCRNSTTAGIIAFEAEI